MAAVTASRRRYVRATQNLTEGYLAAADSITLWDGSLAMRNASNKAAVGADTASCYGLGVVAKKLVTGASNTLVAVFQYGHEEWFPTTGTAPLIGQKLSISDSGTVAVTTTNSVAIGVAKETETKDGVAGVWMTVLGAPVN